MNLLSEIKDSIISEKSNDYIGKVLSDRINSREFKVPEYLYVTDIINPAYSYYARKYPGTEIPGYIYERMKNGEEIHFLARQWFERLPGFSGSEIIMNGGHIGINVVGRADFMLYDSVIEFKTKNTRDITLDSVYDIYRSDLEQLIFYSVLNPNFSEINYLIFFSDGRFTVYMVRIKEADLVKNEMAYRVGMIKRAMVNNDISDFQRCSYFAYGCPYHSAEICKCETLHHNESIWFRNAIEINEDHEMEEKLNYIHKNQEEFIDLKFYDLIYPRKYYHKLNGDEQLAGGTPKHTETGYEKNNIKFAILDSIDSSILNVSGVERAQKNSISMLNLYGDDHYIIKNMYDENSIVPYLLKINNSVYPGKLPETYYSELAITCARRNIDNGIIIVVYPKLNYKIAVYEVKFDIKKIITACSDKIYDINEAVKSGNPEILDICPQFAIKSCTFKNCSCMKEIIKR
ncbi:MAG: hypothetical protein QXZ44_00055 [Ferroplasma sp.]